MRTRQLALPSDPAVVHRVLEHVVDSSVVETELACHLLDGAGSGRVLLKDPDSDADRVCVDREDMRGWQPHKAERRVAARISEVTGQGSLWSLRSLHFSSGFRTPPT